LTLVDGQTQPQKRTTTPNNNTMLQEPTFQGQDYIE